MAHPLRFGVCTGQAPPWGRLLNHWQFCEQLGYDSVWVVDHLVLPGGDEQFGYYEAWVALGGLAALVPRVRLGVLVTDNLFRHPSLLAKQAVTVDHISGGRLELGLGAGWYEREHTAYGFDFPGPGERVERFREAVEILSRSMAESPVTYQGRYYRTDRAPFQPRPIQSPRIPLVLGANGPKMLRIAAQHADTWVTVGTPEQVRERGREFRAACADVGRDPDSVRWSLYIWGARREVEPFASVEAYRDTVERYREVGVTEFVFAMPGRDLRPVMERVAHELLPRWREETAAPSA